MPEQRQAFPRFNRMSRQARNGEIERKAIKRILPVVEREVRRQLSLGGSYRRRKGEKYVPNPGRHLRRGSSDLFNSWTARGVKKKAGHYQGVVASTEPYAAVHEYGGDNIPKRPYVKPTIKAKRKQALNILKSEFRRAFGGGLR